MCRTACPSFERLGFAKLTCPILLLERLTIVYPTMRLEGSNRTESTQEEWRRRMSCWKDKALL